jgi:hypothetical protein
MAFPHVETLLANTALDVQSRSVRLSSKQGEYDANYELLATPLIHAGSSARD